MTFYIYPYKGILHRHRSFYKDPVKQILHTQFVFEIFTIWAGCRICRIYVGIFFSCSLDCLCFFFWGGIRAWQTLTLGMDTHGKIENLLKYDMFFFMENGEIIHRFSMKNGATPKNCLCFFHGKSIWKWMILQFKNPRQTAKLFPKTQSEFSQTSTGARCKVLFDGKLEAEMVASEELFKVQLLGREISHC